MEQHSISPEIGVHGLPVDNFSRSASGGVNLCRFSVGLDLSEPASYHWSSRTSVKFEVNVKHIWKIEIGLVSISATPLLAGSNHYFFLCSMFVPSTMKAGP